MPVSPRATWIFLWFLPNTRSVSTVVYKMFARRSIQTWPLCCIWRLGFFCLPSSTAALPQPPFVSFLKGTHPSDGLQNAPCPVCFTEISLRLFICLPCFLWRGSKRWRLDHIPAWLPLRILCGWPCVSSHQEAQGTLSWGSWALAAGSRGVGCSPLCQVPPQSFISWSHLLGTFAWLSQDRASELEIKYFTSEKQTLVRTIRLASPNLSEYL